MYICVNFYSLVSSLSACAASVFAFFLSLSMQSEMLNFGINLYGMGLVAISAMLWISYMHELSDSS